MHIVIGASGQVGSAVVRHLTGQGQPVKGIIRDEKKAAPLKETGAAVGVADIQDLSALTAALKDGSTLFVITPESGHSQDMIAETAQALENYRKALETSPVKRLVGISSMGAQHEKGTGNLQMSYMLEHAFNGTAVEQVFIRPAYYFSNWLPNLSTVKKSGVLPTFFPVDLSIPMVSPMDVAAFAAKVLVNGTPQRIYELEGPAFYNSNDVAGAFADALGIPVKAEQIERDNWGNVLQQLGFSRDGIRNFIEMTAAVVSGLTMRDRGNTAIVKGNTSLQQYMQENLRSD